MNVMKWNKNHKFVRSNKFTHSQHGREREREEDTDDVDVKDIFILTQHPWLE